MRFFPHKQCLPNDILQSEFCFIFKKKQKQKKKQQQQQQKKQNKTTTPCQGQDGVELPHKNDRCDQWKILKDCLSSNIF